MKRLSRYLLITAVSVLLLLGLLSIRVGRDDPEFSLKNRLPKITVIVIWTIRNSPPNYIPYFFQSVEANPQVDLLFVQVDKKRLGCSSYSTAPNVKEICLSEDQYYQLHVKFLCKRWQCSEEDKVVLFEHIKRAGDIDGNNSFFRVLRNGIFMRWIDPLTTVWGWCDVDTFWGNFSRTFPWDAVHDFDVIAATPQPEFANQRLLFTRGHMSFFRHSAEVLDKFHSFPKFASLSSYLIQPGTLFDAEESEFSHYIYSEEESFTFLNFEGMVNSWDTVLLSDRGTFYAHVQEKDLSPSQRMRLISLVRPTDRAPVRPTFSPDSIEEKALVFRNGQHYDGSLWFDAKYATIVETGWIQPAEREQKAYFLRRDPYGPITQRLEPRERYLVRDDELAVDECLYKHWQTEKHESWFRKIPSVGLQHGQIFIQHNNAEAEIWDESGEVVYSTGR